MGSTPGLTLSVNNLGQLVHTHASVTANSVLVKPGDALQLGRSGVTLAMRHRLQWFIHSWAQDQRKRDEHPTYTPHGLV